MICPNKHNWNLQILKITLDIVSFILVFGFFVCKVLLEKLFFTTFTVEEPNEDSRLKQCKWCQLYGHTAN